MMHSILPFSFESANFDEFNLDFRALLSETQSPILANKVFSIINVFPFRITRNPFVLSFALAFAVGVLSLF